MNDLSMLTQLNNVNKTFSNFLKKIQKSNAALNTYSIFTDFENELENFYRICAVPELSTKSIVGLGGAFSAGKSSLLNCLLGQKILSAQINPTTSLPTYLIHAEELEIQAIQNEGIKHSISLEQLKKMTHQVPEHLKKLAQNTHLVVVKQPRLSWHQLAFLDTPGYSNSNTTHQNTSDSEIAKVQLNRAQHIIWVISADQGVISQCDIDFLKTLDVTIPKLIVITRADKKLPEDLESIKLLTAQTLTQHQLEYLDVLALSTRQSQDFDYAKLDQYLKNWNKKITSYAVFDQFSLLFNQLEQQLNTLDLKVELELIQKQIFESIYQLGQVSQLDLEKPWKQYLKQQNSIELKRQEILQKYQAELEQETKRLEQQCKLQESQKQQGQLQDLISKANQIKQQLTQPTKRSLDELLDQYPDDIRAPKAGAYLGSDLNRVRKKIESAIKSYAYAGDGDYGKYNDDPLLLIDTTTLFKNAEQGLYLTHSELYCKDIFSKRFVIRLNLIRNIRFDTNESKLYVNSEEVLYIPQNDLKRAVQFLARVLKIYIEQ